MELGNFSELAKSYINRAGYSKVVMDVLLNHIKKNKNSIAIADVGAGTGKMTEILIELGCKGYAVEPNEAMRNEGIRLMGQNPSFKWIKGSAEETSLPDNSVDWVIMASSFHWTNHLYSLKEFYRILSPGGFFTAIWNPRDLENNEFHKNIENKIYAMLPNLNRVSSGAKKYTTDIEQKLLSVRLFTNLFFLEAPHEEVMTKERYMGAWKSVNDIQAQAGKEKFDEILSMINDEIKDNNEIIVPYRSRAWTVQSQKGA